VNCTAEAEEPKQDPTQFLNWAGSCSFLFVTSTVGIARAALYLRRLFFQPELMQCRKPLNVSDGP
jgi:hypothetical protein